MKNIFIIGICLILNSCFKDYDEKFYYRNLAVEFQDAVINNNAVGKTYPIINAKNGINDFQVNLLGELSSSKNEVKIKIIKEESTAISGKNFTLINDGKVTFPGNTAIANLKIEVPKLEKSENVLLVVELMPSNEIKVNKNYNRIGIRIKN